jgi:phosphoribosylformylglycinamidine cyclo-ligase
MKSHVARTVTNGVLSGIGGFGGLFELPSGYDKPVLVSGTDGVGTKLKLAFILDKHDTIGIDCVAMCVNDIICSGAQPLFFLDYIATGKNIPEKIEKIVSGIAEGCVQAGCALIGGETAEHPGMMPEDEYDLAGFSVGIVDKTKIPDKSLVKAGDVIIALASSGVHSNGFSLIRKVFGIEKDRGILEQHFPELGKTLGEELLTPTKIYVKPLLRLFEKGLVRSACHITGGGFYENLPRAFGENVGAIVYKDKVETPAIFNLIAEKGGIPQRDMFNTYNMGAGLCVICSGKDADEALDLLQLSGEKAAVIGEIRDGSGVEIQ